MSIFENRGTQLQKITYNLKYTDEFSYDHAKSFVKKLYSELFPDSTTYYVQGYEEMKEKKWNKLLKYSKKYFGKEKNKKKFARLSKLSKTPIQDTNAIIIDDIVK